MTKYKELFSVSFQHEYFSQSGKLRMNCYPSKDTLRLLHNMGVIFKPFDDGCKLLFDLKVYQNSEKLYKLFSNENITLVFFPQDSREFYNYTAGFNAKNENVSLFSINKDTAVQPNKIDLGFGHLIESNSKLFSKQEQSEFLARNKRQTPIVFKVNTDELVKISQVTQYQLSFKSIKSHYKYYLFNINNSEELQLVDVDKQVVFSSKQEVLENGKQAQVFISNSPVTSFFQSTQHFQLTENVSKSKRVVMDYMPVPKPGRYFTDQLNGKSVMVSEIFIN